jgi:cell division GTPase FtsZ
MKSNKQIHIVGLGGGGCNTLEYIYKQRFDAEYTCITFPLRNLPAEIKFIFFHPSISLIDSPEGLLEKKLDLPQNIKRVFEPDKLYVLLASLGGYTGTSFIKALFEYLPSRNRDFIAICSYPFKFEGLQRLQNSKNMTQPFQNAPNFIGFHLDSIIEDYGNITLSEVFNKADMEFYRILKASV